jgi:hypothetical protein
MKYGFLILLLLIPILIVAQDPAEPVSAIETIFENTPESDQESIDDDNYLQQLDFYRRRPLNLNTATEEEMAALNILHELQLKNFISYRRLMGNLISIYELQAIPGWDIGLIRQLLPYITVSNRISLIENFLERREGAVNSLLLRYANIIENPEGYAKLVTPGSQYYMGSRAQLMLRYKYNYMNSIQMSLLGKKDAGEEFFKGSQKQGFGFYSGHLLLRNVGLIRCFIAGDFTVNMGQGLIQWQNFAFGKGPAVLSVKKQSPALVPYNSTGELNFQRGLGIIIGKRNWETCFFISYRKLSGNISIDAMDNEKHVTSFNSSGYFRTSSEIADRGNTGQVSFGSSLKYKTTAWHIALNTVHYSFSEFLQKRDELYNLYSINGKKWWNAGVDYSYTYRNIHFFGETAIDKNANLASLNGLLLSLDNKLDVSFIYRDINKKYQTLYASAFTESSLPTNEKGFYLGISLRLTSSVKLDAYADMYRFPWLKYRVNANSTGYDYLLQISFTPGRNIMLYSRLHYKTKLLNNADAATVLQPVIAFPKLNWRLHASIGIDKQSSIQNRVELTWFNGQSENKEEGFLFLTEYSRKLCRNKLQGSLRLQYFETNGYDSRIYVYERDLLYSAAIPAFFDKGLRYYINMRLDCSQFLKNIFPTSSMKIDMWMKWSQYIYSGKSIVGEGLDQINGNVKSNIRLQILIFF